jgi:hypothetical protein
VPLSLSAERVEFQSPVSTHTPVDVCDLWTRAQHILVSEKQLAM